VSTPRTGTSARDEVRTVAPKLIEMTEKVVYGAVLANGVTREEIGEVITHMALYAGWPTAMSAGRIAKKTFEGAKS
jgi:4-carboxymuconolactone decarboxylase